MKDKTDRILEYIEDPGLNDKAMMKEILDDPETAEIYRTLSMTADALTETTEPDVDFEWDTFMKTNRNVFLNHKKGLFRQFYSRKVAVASVIAVASLSLVAAGISISYSVSNRNYGHRVEADGKINSSSEKTYDAVEDTIKSDVLSLQEAPLVVFKDESLETILTEMSGHYVVAITYKNDVVKNIHLYFQWNRSQSLAETLSQLNHFQRINIMLEDNSIIVE